MEATKDYFALALAAAGTCAPGNEPAFFAHVRNLAFAIRKQEEVTNSIMRDMARCENKERGFGIFRATITKVELRPDKASRGYIYYTETDPKTGAVKTTDEKGNPLMIRTQPTSSNMEAAGLFNLLTNMVGHNVVIYKRPDPDGGRSNQEAVRTIFHFEDQGLAQQPAAQVNATPKTPQNEPLAIQQSAPEQQGTSPQRQQQALTNQQRAVILAVKSTYPNIPQEIAVSVAKAVWEHIGNPKAPVSQEQLDKACTFAVDEATRLANQRR